MASHQSQMQGFRLLTSRQRQFRSCVLMKSPRGRKGHGKKRNPFDFDAPRFTDFTRKHFVITKGLLEDALKIPKSSRPETCTSTEFTVTDLDESWYDEMDPNASCPFDNEADDEDWFERSHPSHEPTSPLSPPGPLITPDVSGCKAMMMDPREPHHLVSPTNRSRMQLSSGTSSIGTFSDSKSSASAFGLRSKPLRVLNNPSGSHRGSSLKNGSLNVTPRAKDDHTTIRSSNMTRVTFDLENSDDDNYAMDVDTTGEKDYANRMSVSSNAYTMTGNSTHEDLLGGRISSLPSLDGWLNSSASFLPSPPKCRLPIEDEEHYAKPSTSSSGGIRKLGLASRATRVQIALDEHATTNPVVAKTASKNVSPDIKRIRTDSKFCPAPSVPFSTISMRKPTTDKPAKIDDLKKILAEHNQRIRPRKQR